MLKTPKYTNVIKIIDLVDDYDLFLFDIWGVVLEGEMIYDQVVEVVNYIISKKNIMFVSNAPRTKESTHLRLQNYGFKVKENMIMTAGELTKNILSNPGKYLSIENPIIYNIGLPHHEELWHKLNIQTTQNLDEASLIVISLNYPQKSIEEYSYDLFKKAAELNIPAICSNNDRIAVQNGEINYCAGYFAEQFEKFGGKVLYMGKPFEPIFTAALNMHAGISKERVLMIGDTIDTDILGANNIGIHSALVITGNIGLSLQKFDSIEAKLAEVARLCEKRNTYANHIVSLTL
jgi:HAD superfamily hydrolase (TIGR01459 family)